MADRDIPEEMAEKATFWNERVGRVEPTREGQPLRWWYGPLKASADPNQKWCHDCYGVVDEGNGRRWCRLCKASQPLFDEIVEKQADQTARELAPTWVRYPVGISSIASLRALIAQALSAALAGRTVVAGVHGHDDNGIVLRIARSHEWIAHACGQRLGFPIPSWDDLTPRQQGRAEETARNWLRAAHNAGVQLAPAGSESVSPKGGETDGATTCQPSCDRKPGHPGVCMTRCTATPGCTERVGHRGRCTEGTFNEVGWAVDAERALTESDTQAGTP